MKKLLLLFSVFSLSLLNLHAQSNETERTLRCVVFFDWGVFQLTEDAQRTELDKFVVQMADYPNTTISIIGWADTVGTNKANNRMSLLRAQSVMKYLVNKGITVQRFVVEGRGSDVASASNQSARRADVSIALVDSVSPNNEVKREPSEPLAAITPKNKECATPPAVEDKREVAATTETNELPFVLIIAEEPVQTTPQEAPSKLKQQQQERIVEIVEESEPETKQPLTHVSHFSLRTNLLYWLGALPNIGFEWQPTSSLGLIVNGGWAPWSSDSWQYNWAGWFVSPEVRLYMGEKKRWFAGVNMVVGEYDLKPVDLGRKGSVIAGGITGGYKMRLSNVFDMDFSLGIGYGQLKYRGYHHLESGENKFSSRWVVRNGFLPTQAGVSLIWKLK